MEIASPLPFHHARPSNKRSFACSSPLLDSADQVVDSAENCSTSMDHVDLYDSGMHVSKRRRRFSGDKIEVLGEAVSPPLPGSLTASNAVSPWGAAQSSFSFGSRGASSKGHYKRSRSERVESEADCDSPQGNKRHISELQVVVHRQATEIDRLKTEKANVECALAEVKAHYDKASAENRILKKAVTIQQERQNHAASELDAACRYKVEAEEQIKRLEHMNMSLRFQLQAKDAAPTHGFMGFNPRPPDVC